MDTFPGTPSPRLEALTEDQRDSTYRRYAPKMPRCRTSKAASPGKPLFHGDCLKTARRSDCGQNVGHRDIDAVATVSWRSYRRPSRAQDFPSTPLAWAHYSLNRLAWKTRGHLLPPATFSSLSCSAYSFMVPVLITLAVIGVASLMGLYGAAGKSTNMVTMVLPTLFLIIGVEDCVHFLGHA